MRPLIDTIGIPLLIVLLAVPLILQWIPRDVRIEGNGFNEEQSTVTGRRVRRLGPGPKWPTEKKDAKILVALIAVPLLLLILVTTWLGR